MHFLQLSFGNARVYVGYLKRWMIFFLELFEYCVPGEEQCLVGFITGKPHLKFENLIADH